MALRLFRVQTKRGHGDRAVAAGSRVIGIQFECLVRVRNRLFVKALIPLGGGTVAVGCRVMGVEIDRLVVIRDRAFVVANVLFGVSAIPISLGKVGVEIDRLVVIPRSPPGGRPDSPWRRRGS